MKMTWHHPIIAAPMAGGVSTPALAAAVSNAGGLGFLAAGYKTADAMRAEIGALRKLTDAPFGMNLFVPGEDAVDEAALAAYAERMRKEAALYGVEPGRPVYDDDDWQGKLQVLRELSVPVVSFTFGCPSSEVVKQLQASGSTVVVTVTSRDEAVTAAEAGADALCVQGSEAGGHQAAFGNALPDREPQSLLELLREVREAAAVPLIAAGGLMHGADVAAVLREGACAAQLGTAFLLCPESGTHAVHRAALTDGRYAATALTRAFTGRRARGLVNRFMREYPDAPAAYPQLHHLTRPIRKAGGDCGDGEAMSLWAGQGYRLARALPASQLVEVLLREAAEAMPEAGGLPS
ncbi:nitronate monooxygenase [Paenibacillus caseinilyticus]|uniref:Probable nitronate monooxygenase n=1 Tax=Paenibacillus mucilaginosus K02 TaxID=997761 RepID=I0BN93_9BACL|nr:nitronate monooxygenase [Paenibacillus mucilaginosus]AFH63840.2 2-nitropropane dioxygenase [Paenibacillus mucilaginosus K02]